MTTHNRRSFLKQSTLAGAGALFLTNGILAKGQSPNEKLAVACIGIGGQGNFQVSNLGKMEDVALVALCDVDDDRAGKAYEKYPDAKKFYDFRKLFDELEKSLDAVAVSTPDHTHYHPVMRALRAKKHVYCEKPLAHSVTEIRNITDTAAKMGVATQLGCQRHAIPNMARVVELIQSGAIGEVTEVHSWMGGDRGMPAMPDKEVPPPASIHWDEWLGPCPRDWKYAVNFKDGKEVPAFAPYNWRFWRDFGTGETGNWSCHILDIPYWALNLKYPSRVSASGTDVDALRTPKEMFVEYDFPARGSLPAVKLYWSHTKTQKCFDKFGIDRNIKDKDGKGIGANNLFVGTKGMLLTGFDRHILLPEDKFSDFERPAQTIPKSPGFHREWVNACKGGTSATCDFSYSAPMAETAILGNTAFFAGHKTFDWDAANLIAKGCPEVQSALKPEFRKGWNY